MGACVSVSKTRTRPSKKKLVKTPNMVSPTNSPDTAEEYGGIPKKPSFTSHSTNTISGIDFPLSDDSLQNLAPVATPTTTVDKVKSRWSFSSSKRSFGSSREETFFDSHNQWQQSDSEDDFYSVNGDFTPSRGNTPNCSFSDKPRVSFSHPPAAPRRKKLAELFRDSIREKREEIMEESSENQSEESRRSSGDNSSDELKAIEDSEKEKKNVKSFNHHLHHHHRCLPRFSTFKGSLLEKRKKKKKKIHVKGD